MTRFTDWLASINLETASVDFDRFKANAIAEYEADTSVYTAKIDSLTEQDTARANEIRDLKVRQYDLLMQVPGTPTPDGKPPAPGTPALPVGEDDDPVVNTTVDDLFGAPKE